MSITELSDEIKNMEIEIKTFNEINNFSLEAKESNEPDPKTTITPSDILTADGVLTIEEQLRLLAIEDAKMKIDDEKQKRRNLITRVKTICLSKMGKEPLINTSQLTYIERDELITLMNTYGDKSEDIIITEFNAICTNKIFNNPKYDYVNLPLYSI